VILPPARRRRGGAGPFLPSTELRATRRTPRAAGPHGISAVGMVLTLTVAATVLALASPGVAQLQSAVSIRSAAGEVGVAFFRARSLAISRGRYVGLKFRKNGDRYEWTAYVDGNGNGIRSNDISRGIDLPIASFGWTRNDVRPSILLGTRVPDPGQAGAFLDRLDDPIRFNASDICSFSPLGESTPGSVYLWDGRDRMAVVRVYGRSAKMRTLYHRRGETSWSP
jgi:hypothetical protein